MFKITKETKILEKKKLFNHTQSTVTMNIDILKIRHTVRLYTVHTTLQKAVARFFLTNNKLSVSNARCVVSLTPCTDCSTVTDTSNFLKHFHLFETYFDSKPLHSRSRTAILNASAMT